MTSEPATTPEEQTFALIGAAGYIAGKHFAAMKETGNNLVAATDPHDSVGLLDRYFPEASFFTEIERFDRFLEKHRRSKCLSPIKYVSICTPNYLHDAHVRLALRTGAHAICEKPLVINPWNLDQLSDLESEFGSKVHTVLQLRHHPNVVALKKRIENEKSASRREVCLTYITRRGKWYHHSWKGDENKSGGLAMNIGIHFFDFLQWIFGRNERSTVQLSTPSRMAGILELEYARVKWFLSVDADDLPTTIRDKGGYCYRNLTVDKEELDLSVGFTDLHTIVYQEILKGNGHGLDDARPSIELVHNIRHTRETGINELSHPRLTATVW